MKTMNLTLMLFLFAACAFAQNVPSYVPSNGLVGWFPFNGNANDESGNGNNGTVNGATLTSDRFGNAGKAYSFNNTNILIPNNMSFNFINFSLSFWVSTTNISNCQSLIKKCNFSNAANEQWAIALVDTSVVVFGKYNNPSCTPGVWRSSDYTYSDLFNNEYHHLTYTINLDTMRLYIDGYLTNQIITNSNQLNSCFGGDIQIGRNWANDLCFYNGKLDDIGIWNRALTQQEISNLYNGGICYQTITVTDTLLINTGITGFNPVTYENTIRIWPNPTYDHITIDAGNLNVMNGYSIRIVNALGQQVFQSAITQQQFYLDLNTWTGSGIYYVNIINAQGVTIDTRKIVLQ